ncbi:unnamed protein product [Phytomonas sp. EM1]|nr:unnamed protein product [Phytomonas sp. EM1]|eukprot:CCW63339.1 unnamed protein product [Phytomonas sp. isolate EM1]
MHQHVTYLRLKRLPFKLHCSSITTTAFYAFYLRARSAFSTVTPSGATAVQLWQLAERVELDEDLSSIRRDVCNDSRGGELRASLTSPRRILLDKRSHPSLHLACWAVVVYACWWLGKSSAMYRWIRGDSLDTLAGYIRYFLIIPAPGFARLIAPKFRELMARLLGISGINKDSAVFMEEHFHRLCAALEAHFGQHPEGIFLLRTPHPTLADVTLGAVFSGGFLRDDPPASFVAEKYPNLAAYVARVTGWKGGIFVNSPPRTGKGEGDKEGRHSDPVFSAASSSEEEDVYPDEVPESLSAFFENMIEVFPFLVSQCAAFKAYMSSDAVRSLRREPLEEPWKGCHGYLLPQLTAIRSLMIIDSSIFNVHARAQDLEVAFLAAREVCDDALGHFNRLDAAAAREESTEAGVRSIAGESSPSPSPSPNAIVLEPHPSAPEMGNETSSALDKKIENDAISNPPLQEGEAPLESLGSERQRFFTAAELKDFDPDSADFYRVFTTQGKRSMRSVALRRSPRVVGDLVKGRVNPERAAVALRSSIGDHLDLIRSMMSKMQCPQYTLSTVFHGRRVYVAVIPEHEVDKVRKQRS